MNGLFSLIHQEQRILLSDEYKTTIQLNPELLKEPVVDLKVGDMLIYSGCELEHWREPFEGTVCSQVFLAL